MDAQLAVNATLFTAATLHLLLPLRPDGLARFAERIVERVRATFREWRLRARSRRELARLDEHQLRDIGLSPSQASFESGKSFLER